MSWHLVGQGDTDGGGLDETEVQALIDATTAPISALQTTHATALRKLLAGIFAGRGGSGAVTASGTASLAANVYATTYTIPDTATVRTVGFAIYATGDITLGGGSSGVLEYAAPATINASGPTAGAGGTSASQSIGAGAIAGGAGGNFGAGTAGGNGAAWPFATLPGSGGAGGNGVAAGAAGGTSPALSATAGTMLGTMLDIPTLNNSYQTSQVRIGSGGSGGGGGGDNAAGRGGGGGASGGNQVIISGGTITSLANFTWRVKGGDGGTPTNSAGLAQGGGGGGCGGNGLGIAAALALTVTPNVAGGTKGNGINGGTDGANGPAGAFKFYVPNVTTGAWDVTTY